VIRDRINRLDVAVTKARRDGPLTSVLGGIEQAKTAARLNGKGIGPTDWLGQWITGSAIEAAWRGLHLAEEEFVLHAQEDWVLERLSETQQALYTLGILGPRATAAQRVVLETKADRLGKDERQALKATLGALNLRSDNSHSDVRTLRNILFSITTLLLFGLAALALAAAIAPIPFALCGVPAPSDCQAPTVWQIEVAGGFGGLLSAVVFLSNLRAQNTPYTIWLYQGLLKVPTGAALAVILVFLVQTGLLGFLKPGTAYVIPYAFVFGFAQQAATQLVDNWAGGIVGASSTSN
jgi:hypothetical protein